MPVTTRSQSKKRIQEYKNTTTLTQLFYPYEPKTKTLLSESERIDFIKELRNRIAESKEIMEESLYYKRRAAHFSNIGIQIYYMRVHKYYYFKNLSHIIDMFQYIDSQFGKFFVADGNILNYSPSIQRLIDTILEKCNEFEVSVETTCPTNLTEEYTKVLNDFNVQLKKTKALFEPYGSPKKEPRYPKRSIRAVCYTGMDIVEPESSYDGITDIWADRTIHTDPDYVYESDEDDEYDEGEYVSDDNEDEEEFEDYDSDEEEPCVVYEDEPEDCFDQEEEEEEEEDDDFIVEKVNDRHIRFVYK